jgi:predicted MFS family arabinose efflux permease
MPHNAERIKVLIAGVCSLTLMMGVARFAYTPMLPLMQEQAGLSTEQGAWLASINYMGYLCGVLIAALISDMSLKDRLYRIGILVAIVTTVMMALTVDWRIWGISRFFAGLSSAAGLMLGSGLILNWLMRHHFRSELGIHFAGIGMGIFATSLLIEMLGGGFDWRGEWLWLSGLGLLLAIPAWLWLPRPRNSHMTIGGKALEDRAPSNAFLAVFMAAYFCAGIGYVVSATFIVAIVEQKPGLEGQGNLVFMLLGLAAIPACIFWDRVARVVGDLNALILACLVQIFGIALPLMNNSLTTALLSAVLFGATFVGIVSLVLTMAGRYYPSRPAKMMGKMTFSYSVAQILAPALIAVMADRQGGYSQGLYLASAAMVVGFVLMLVLKRMETAHAVPAASAES